MNGLRMLPFWHDATFHLQTIIFSVPIKVANILEKTLPQSSEVFISQCVQSTNAELAQE